VSESEHKLLDVQGKFLRAIQNGHKLNDASWTPGRIILSNKRVIVATEGGKFTIPLSEVRTIGGRYDVNQAIASVSDYVSLHRGDNVVLFTLPSTEDFTWLLYEALLDGTIVLAKHPAVEGGVVQSTDWNKGQLSMDEDAVGVAIANGSFVEIELADVGSVESDTRTVTGDERPVVEVEHTEGATSVETHLSGTERRCELVGSLFDKRARENEVEIDLDGAEQQVLMALYSGVSPFEIPEFVGMDIDVVEETYERLIELEVLDEVRKRREVTLTTRGRNLASESINDE
jgi:helix-turn-helix protein